MAVEQTVISCAAVRTKCGIKRVVLPDDFDPSLTYDKWGNTVVLPSAADRESQLKSGACMRAFTRIATGCAGLSLSQY
jgi:hypothetical protein